MKTFIIALTVGVVGLVAGVVGENFRYGIVCHEARKGDAEAQQIMDELAGLGALIEATCGKQKAA